MEDLAEKLNAMLNDPQTMQQVSALAGMLQNGRQSAQEGLSPQTGNSIGTQSSSNLSALAGLLGVQQNQTQATPMQGELMQSMLQILPLLQSFQREDDTTRLLQSLRPLLSDARQKKLDEAAKMMKVFRLLPLLKQKGML